VPTQLLQPFTRLVPVRHSEWVQAGAAKQTLLVQLWPLPQVPHESVPPQPSLMVPQFLPCAAQVVGTQDVQTLLVQLWPAPHVPQVSAPPQPSPTVPQFLPCAAQLVHTGKATASAEESAAAKSPPPTSVCVEETATAK
jgi:hypothetical protein